MVLPQTSINRGAMWYNKMGRAQVRERINIISQDCQASLRYLSKARVMSVARAVQSKPGFLSSKALCTLLLLTNSCLHPPTISTYP